MPAYPEFVYTRLERSLSPVGWDGWQFVHEDGLDDDWENYIENTLVDYYTKNGARIGVHRDHCLIGHYQQIDTASPAYGHIHDASHRRGVYVLHGLIVPQADIQRHHNGDWRNLARTYPWCRSAAEVQQRFGCLRWADTAPIIEPWWAAIVAARTVANG